MDYLMGILILVEGQYFQGDNIELGNVPWKGTVESVGLRRTVVRDVDGTVYSMSNGELRSVANRTRIYAAAEVRVRGIRQGDLARVTEIMDQVGSASRPTRRSRRPSSRHRSSRTSTNPTTRAASRSCAARSSPASAGAWPPSSGCVSTRRSRPRASSSTRRPSRKGSSAAETDDDAASIGPRASKHACARSLGDRVRSDLGARALFTSDASLYRALPSLVVEPADVDELATVVRICGETGTPLTMRGAGTSIAGNALGSGRGRRHPLSGRASWS